MRMSTPFNTSSFSVEAESSEGIAATGRRLANAPRNLRSLSRPASGRTVPLSKSGWPTAPSRTESEALAASRVSSETGSPLLRMAEAPISRYS